MNPTLAGVALAVIVGAVVAVSARTGRAAVLGLVLTLVAAPFLADPFPDSLGLAARLVGAVLAAYALWIVTRGDTRTTGSRLGWPSEVLVAAAAAVVGFGSHGLGAIGTGPALAQAAGFALAASAVAPVANGRDALGIGLGLSLLASGAVLLRTGLGGTPGPFEQLVVGGFLGALGLAVAAVAAGARSDGTAGFELASGLPGRSRRAPDAHPFEPR